MQECYQKWLNYYYLTVRNYRFEFTEPEDIKRFVRLANDALAPYKE